MPLMCVPFPIALLTRARGVVVSTLYRISVTMYGINCVKTILHAFVTVGGIKTRDPLLRFNTLYSHDIPSADDSRQTMSLHDLSTEV